MIEPIDNAIANITCDNWFMSFSIAPNLIQNYRTTVVGTLRKKRREIPKMLEEAKKMTSESVIFFADKCKLCTKENGNIILVTIVGIRTSLILLLEVITGSR